MPSFRKVGGGGQKLTLKDYGVGVMNGVLCSANILGNKRGGRGGANDQYIKQ